MKNLIVVSFISSVIFYSCTLFSTESLTGIWTLSLSGDYSGELTLVIDDQNKFSGASTVEIQGYKYDVYYSGSVTEEGSLSGKIEANNRKVGELIGKIDFEKGLGKWDAAGLKGEWKAVKGN